MAAVTLRDVAHAAGVSLATASRVLNGSARTPREDVTARVKATATSLGYVANAQAQSLATSVTGLIGLVVHDIADPYFAGIARGFQQTVRAHGKTVLLAAADGTASAGTAVSGSESGTTAEDEARAVEIFAGRRADAIVLAGSRHTQEADRSGNVHLAELLSRFHANGGRAVLLGVVPAGMEGAVEGIAMPNQELGRQLALALHAAGHRNFVILGGPEGMATSDARIIGLQQGLRQSGGAPAHVLRSAFRRDGGYSAAAAVAALAMPDRAAPEIDAPEIAVSEAAVPESAGPESAGSEAHVPLCAVATNDVMAIGLIAGLRDAGVDVPGAVAVAGFDNIETLRDFSPALTTVHIPLEDVGHQAALAALGLPADPERLLTADRMPVLLRASTHVDSIPRHQQKRPGGSGGNDGRQKTMPTAP